MKNPQTCSSCRHNRIACDPDCWLAPYFPAHMHKKYKKAQQVFGKNYMTKLLKSLHQTPHKRSTAMKNVRAEADIRSADPVGGCYGVVKEQCAVIRRLERKIAEQEEELRRLRSQLGGGGGGSVYVAMAQPPLATAMYQEQGYNTFQQNLEEQNYNASQGYDQEQGNFAQGFPHVHQEEGNIVQGYRIRQEQTNIVAQSQGYVQAPTHHQQLLPEPNQEQGDIFDFRDEVVVFVPEHDGLEPRPLTQFR
ncbi:protein LATERAL ORGAN BOUNDARIES-like [Rosa sericea]